MRRLVAVLAVLGVAGVCGGAVIRVEADGTGDYPTVQAAIEAAVSGDEVVLGDGVYTGAGNRDIDFAGKMITVRGENGAENCVVDCNSLGRGFHFHSGEDSNSVLEGVTILHGMADFGGAILCETSGPKIIDCVLAENNAGYRGGAIGILNGSARIIGCDIRNNRSFVLGGGVMCLSASVETAITNCTIRSNWANDEGGGLWGGLGNVIGCVITENRAGEDGSDAAKPGGGGIANWSGDIIDCVISGNFAAGSGGGLSGCRDGTIADCVITENEAGLNGGGLASCNGRIENCIASNNVAMREGGGLYGCMGGNISDCVIRENGAGLHGGGLALCSGRIENCIVSNNVATQEGGGLYKCNGNISDSTITANEAGLNGGGLAWCNGVVENCVISDNLGIGDGGGLSNCGKGSGVNRIANCLIADNMAQTGNGGAMDQCEGEIINCTVAGNSGDVVSGLYCCESVVVRNCIIWNESVNLHFTSDLRNSCFPEADGSNGNVSGDPAFVGGGDYSLRAGSSCIDAGENSYVPGDIVTDLDGKTRLLDASGIPGSEARVDMGAYEYSYASATPELVVEPGHVRLMTAGAALEDSVLVANTGAGTIEWGAEWECGWLGVVPPGGTCGGAGEKVSFVANPAGLGAGVYNCEVILADKGGLAGAVTVKVSLIVGNAQLVPDEFGTIQSAIDATPAGGMVVVADGVYSGEGNRDITFRGKAITVRSENGPENCIIDCNSVYGDHRTQWRGFVFTSGEGRDSILNGFTIVRGIGFYGGGIYCARSSPTIMNCAVKSSSARCGGGVCCDTVNLDENRCEPRIVNCVIADNEARGVMEDTYGGGIYCRTGSTPRIEGCIISGNVAKALHEFIEPKSFGGGVYCDGGSGAVLEGCIICDNRAEQGGGLCLSYRESWGAGVDISCCRIVGNESAGYGGGVYAYRPDGEMRSSLIACNEARHGAGVYVEEGELPINNCTIGYNRAVRMGGGLYADNSSVRMTNCVVWGNTDSEVPPWSAQAYSDYYGPGGLDTGFCCVQDDDPCDGEIPFGDANSFNRDDWPIFVREPNDGGDGWGDNPDTSDVDEGANDDYGDLHLQKDSPCIDTGNPHAWVAAGSIDIDGDARIIGRGIDIGADEYSPVAMVTKPAGGEVWAAGSLQEICWKSDVVGSAHIMLSRDGGAAWVVIATVDAGEGRYFWEVPNGNSERCVLKVVPSTPDGDVIVYESGIFAIHQDNMPRNRIDSAWSTLGQDFDRAGTSEINGPLTGCVKWRFDTDGAVVSSITAGFNRRVHIACENGMLYTLTKNGDAVWEFDANSPLVSAPTVGTDGSVYVGDEEGRIYAIARNGKLRWTFDTGGPVYSAPAVSNDGQIYVCSADGTMRALGSEGTELWLARTGTLDGTDGVIMASPAIGADGTIYVGGVYDANLYAFNPDGSRKWACNFAWGDGGGVRGRPIASPVVGADGTIYQTLVYDPNLYAVNPEDGSIKWASRMTPYCEWVEENGLFPPDLSEYCDDWYGIDPNEWFYYGTGYSSPAVGPDGTVYISFDDPYLRAVDPNGTIRWVTQLGEAAGFDLAVDRDGYIYAACEDGQLYVVSPDGTPMSMFEADEWLGYPVIAEDGTVIFSGSRDNTTMAEPALNSVWALSRDGCVDGELDLDLIADVNGDGIIDSADLLVIADDWLGKDKEEKKADKGQAVGQREEGPAAERQMKGAR